MEAIMIKYHSFGFFIFTAALLTYSNVSYAGELIYQFKNPSFSGVGASSHWLTIQNQEYTRKATIEAAIAANLKAQALANANSILNRFMNNLQSRIYSQIAQQLTQNLFSSPSATGTFSLEGNTIQYTNTGDSIVLNITDDKGDVTNITIPVGGFNF
jgi:hypothetical protein